MQALQSGRRALALAEEIGDPVLTLSARNMVSNVRFRKVGMTARGVRREKAALSSGCEPHPATAPAGSNGDDDGRLLFSDSVRRSEKRMEASHEQGYDNCSGHRKAGLQFVLGRY